MNAANANAVHELVVDVKSAAFCARTPKLHAAWANAIAFRNSGKIGLQLKLDTPPTSKRAIFMRPLTSRSLDHLAVLCPLFAFGAFV